MIITQFYNTNPMHQKIQFKLTTVTLAFYFVFYHIPGDHYLEVGLKDTEELNVNLIWDVVDWYRKAILLTQEHDVENEAITYSRLGHLYDKVLKLKYKAKENYKICLELSQSLYPKIFTTFGKALFNYMVFIFFWGKRKIIDGKKGRKQLQ